jgi:hypothetical protein
MQTAFTSLKDYLAAQLAKQSGDFRIVRAEPYRTTRQHWASPYQVFVARFLVAGPKGYLWVEALYPVRLAEAANEHGEMPLRATVQGYQGSLKLASDPVYCTPGDYPAVWHGLAGLLSRVSN